MLSVETLHTFDTEYSADSVEWNEGGVFAVGTYQLEERDENSSKSKRKGRIYLFEFDGEKETLERHQQLETEAILDQKWYKKNILITATSLGKVQCYKFNENSLTMNSALILSESDGENLALSIDIDENNGRMAASDSQGKISLIDVNSLEIKSQWKAHDFEAWTCAFDRWNQNLIYSGGDDSKFNIWDIRSTEKALKSRLRDAGVTSFLSYKENQLFVGSYDEHLSLYDTRNLKQSLDEINLGGGIWRIKRKDNLILVACMYHNFSIVDCSTKMELVAEYNEHKSICYGCDWSPQINENYHFFASCSFYDHRLSVCRVKLVKN